jgi:hypothetical protein
MPAELALLRAEADAGHVLFDHQRADALGAFLAGADHGDVDLVLAAARDERLGARDDIMVAVPHRRVLSAAASDPLAGSVRQ